MKEGRKRREGGDKGKVVQDYDSLEEEKKRRR
jgi:hypothetical protein